MKHSTILGKPHSTVKDGFIVLYARIFCFAGGECFDLLRGCNRIGEDSSDRVFDQKIITSGTCSRFIAKFLIKCNTDSVMRDVCETCGYRQTLSQGFT